MKCMCMRVCFKNIIGFLLVSCNTVHKHVLTVPRRSRSSSGCLSPNPDLNPYPDPDPVPVSMSKLNANTHTHTRTSSPLAFAMSRLYADMWSAEGGRVQTPSLGDDGGGGARGGEGGGGRRVQSATGVLRALVKGNRWFAGDGQHDAHEALRSMLNLLHEELRRPVRRNMIRGMGAGRGGVVGGGGVCRGERRRCFISLCNRRPRP